MLAATEAMIELLALADGERRCLLGVERAAGLVFPAGLFQGDALVDDLDDIGAGQEFINKGLWDTACHAD